MGVCGGVWCDGVCVWGCVWCDGVWVGVWCAGVWVWCGVMVCVGGGVVCWCVGVVWCDGVCGWGCGVLVCTQHLYLLVYLPTCTLSTLVWSAMCFRVGPAPDLRIACVMCSHCCCTVFHSQMRSQTSSGLCLMDRLTLCGSSP